MMVVMVTSRRVGQVTLVASERTSCRNLNGLKAIDDVIRVRSDDLYVSRNPNSPLAPNPLLKDEPASGLDCSGDFKAAPDIRQTGRQQVAVMYCGWGFRSRLRRLGSVRENPATEGGEGHALRFPWPNQLYRTINAGSAHDVINLLPLPIFAATVTLPATALRGL